MFTKSESNNAICVRLQNVRKHPNADKVLLATALNEQVVVGPDYKDGDLMIYFDSNLRLSPEFLRNNNQYETSELNLDTTKKGYFGRNGKVRAKKFRGEPSYGYVVPVEYFDYLKITTIKFEEGIEFTHIKGNLVCEKFINLEVLKQSIKAGKNERNKVRKITSDYFKEHWDTAHFKRCYHTIPAGQLLYITAKFHGSSGRISYVPETQQLTLVDKLLGLVGIKRAKEYKYFNGTRRVNLTVNKTANSYYKGDMRTEIFEKYSPMLHKGETLYFEICGYDTNGSWIQKGFPYGCKVGKYRVMLYRVTQINEDGKVFNMPVDYVQTRAVELGMDPMYIFEKYYYTGNVEELLSNVGHYTEDIKVDPQYPETMHEGVCVFFNDSQGNLTCLKSKAYAFIERESKVKDAGEVDVEDIN